MPKGSKMTGSKGSEVKITSYDEFGKTVFDGFLSVRPLGQTTFTITYSIPANLVQNGSLPLLIQKQPGLSEEEFEIQVNGKSVQKIKLNTDKETKVSL